MRARIAIAWLVSSIVSVPLVSGQQAPAGEPLKWFKGNTHTHSLNSDGDSSRTTWRAGTVNSGTIFSSSPITMSSRRWKGSMPFFRHPGSVSRDSRRGGHRPGGGKPVHLNMLGEYGVVPPQGGTYVAEALRRNVQAIAAARGVTSINHPNFGWAMSADDLLAGRGAHLLEIHNGHFMVNNAAAAGTRASRRCGTAC